MEDKSKYGSFKVPKGYFEEFPGKLESHLSGNLAKIGKGDTGFRVPQNYFENFELELRKRLSTESGRTIPLWRQSKFLWSTAIAASLILSLFIKYSNNTHTPTFDDLARGDIEIYLETRYEDMSMSELAETIPFTEVDYGDVMEDIPHENHILDYLEHQTEAYDHYNFENDE